MEDEMNMGKLNSGRLMNEISILGSRELHCGGIGPVQPGDYAVYY